MNEPREPQTVTFGDGDQHTAEFSTGDLKGLASETHYSGLSHFFGTRYNDEDDDVTDLSPKSVIQLLQVYVRDRGVPFVFDTTATDQVWNFPVWKYELRLTETTEGGSTGASGLININTAGQSELETLWGISTVRGQRIIAYRQANGPFQTPEDIINVSGIGRGIFNRISDSITTSAASDLRSFTGTIVATFSTDGVGAAHLDTDQENPQSFNKTWSFSLEASPAGEIITSTWDDNENHPDFGWTPYGNTVRSGNSENPFLNWIHLKGHYFADDAVRQ
jgi:competence ComEA-like helix-hairpin-helix protein